MQCLQLNSPKNFMTNKNPINTSKIRQLILKTVIGLSCLFSPLSFAQTQTLGDFILKTTQNLDAQVTGIQLFTKQPDHNVFLGISCNSMNPLPMVEILIFDENLISDTAKYLSVTTDLDLSFQMNGILTATQTYEETSNKIRIEVESKKMSQLQAYSQTLLQQLKTQSAVTFTLSHKSLGSHSFTFSLNGLGELIKPYESICK